MARRHPQRTAAITTLTPRAPESAPEEVPTRGSFWSPARTWIAVAGLLALHYALAANSSAHENPTIDEVIHLPAGITYWQTGTFKLYHHNPPLVKLIAALPALAMRPVMEPLYRSSYWQGECPNKAGFAHEFSSINAQKYFEIFARSRLLMPFFSVLGGLVVFAWSRRLYGVPGGLLSLALWALCPNVLAHGRLITTDVGATALGAGATFLFWRTLQRPTLDRTILSGVALGFAELTKFSMILLYGIWPLLWLTWELLEAQRPVQKPGLSQKPGFSAQFVGISQRTAQAFVMGLTILTVSLLVLNAGYGFEGVGVPLGRYQFASRMLARPVKVARAVLPCGNQVLDLAHERRINKFRGTWLAALPVPLPRHYVLGFDEQKLEAEGLPASWRRPLGPGGQVPDEGDERFGYPVYLDGQIRDSGWWYYYFLALAYKVPEGTIVLVGLSLIVLCVSPRSRAGWAEEAALLTVPVIVLGAMSLLTDINLGLRYVLPIFPYLFISAGKLGTWVSGQASRGKRWAATMVVALGLGATALATAMIHPHYLAYFNWASGGPAHGSEHLIDSNLDWGQDLVNLANWLSTHAPGERVGLAYFGQINPIILTKRGEGFDWFLPPALPGRMTPPLPPSHRQLDPAQPVPPGLYAVSASLLRGLDWRVYDPSRLAYYEAKRYAFSYFQELKSFDHIGYSIFLYRVSPADAARLARHWRGSPRRDR